MRTDSRRAGNRVDPTRSLLSIVMNVVVSQVRHHCVYAKLLVFVSSAVARDDRFELTTQGRHADNTVFAVLTSSWDYAALTRGSGGVGFRWWWPRAYRCDGCVVELESVECCAM